MKRVVYIVMIIIFIIMGTSCGNGKVDNNTSEQEAQNQEHGKISKNQVIEEVMNHPVIKDVRTEGGKIQVLDAIDLTEQDGIWEVNVEETNTNTLYSYHVNGYTGEVMDPSIIHQHEWDEESLKKEMVENMQWVFENWQTFDYQNYDPTKYGLAFSLNFRLSYIFDNYDANVETVKHHQIVSKVKVEEIKDVGLAFNEEDQTLYGQVRIITQYNQKIDGEEYDEPVEVLIFSKKHEDSHEGWEITNVDMYPTAERSENFNHLFFGFKKPS